MDDEDGLSTAHDGDWRVLPRFAKGISVFVGLPAWVVLLFETVSGREDAGLAQIMLGIFAGVAIFRTIPLFRAYSPMEL